MMVVSNMGVWVLTAVVALAQAAEGSLCANVTNTCSCSAPSSKLFEFICPNLMVQISLQNSVQLQCSSLDMLGDTQLPGLLIGNIELFVLRLCPLPSTSIRKLMNRMGIANVEMLQIQSYSYLNDSLQKMHFENLFNVTSLTLNNNGLTSLPVDIFEDMVNLTFLDMKNNQIELQQGIFQFTPKLDVLELGKNGLTVLKPGIFKNLGNLRLLNLWGNKLWNLTKGVFSDLPKLQSLDLNSNQMEFLRYDVFADLNNLKILSLHSNRFATLPQGLLSRNILLEEFIMNENNRSIVSLPPEFLSNLTNLKIVRLTGSKILALHGNTFSGSNNIKEIYLNRNSLTNLHQDTFTGVNALEYLDLSVNNLETLPSKLFYSNGNLKILRLDYNSIEELPIDLFSELNRLEYLDLRFNKIKEITGDQFGHLSALKTLNISDNLLTNLQSQISPDQSVVSENKHLVDLQLANNSLTQVYVDWRTSTSLQIVNLSYNKFKNLTVVDFEFLADVQVDFSNNNIELVDFKGAVLIATAIVNRFNSSYERDQKTRPKTILLDNNPFNCDCQLFPFVQFIQEVLSPEVQYLFDIPYGNLKCKSPLNLRNMSLKRVPFKLLTCQFPNSSEYCPNSCRCDYRAVDTGYLINCENAGLQEIPPFLPTNNFSSHTELNLGGNQLRSVTLPEDLGYKNVTHLYLAHNNITAINISAASAQLQVLDISYNNLTSLTPAAITVLDNAEDLTSLSVAGNQWSCNCESKDFVRFLKKKFVQVGNLSGVTCEDGRSIASLDDLTLCQLPQIILVAAVASAVFALMLAILTIIYYRYQTEIHIYCFSSKWMFLRWLVSRPDRDANKKYDAFISFAKGDEEFVTRYLVPYLEEKGETKFKLCLHYRNWNPGQTIPSQVLSSVNDSRRTIVVLSPNFLNSVWGSMEFKTAYQQALQDGESRVIPILYEDIGPVCDLDDELKAYLQMTTYVKWGNPWFWQQLTYAMPHPNIDDISCILCCSRRKTVVQGVMFDEEAMKCEYYEKLEKKSDKLNAEFITHPSTDKPSSLVIENLDSNSKTPSNDNDENRKTPLDDHHQNGKVTVCI